MLTLCRRKIFIKLSLTSHDTYILESSFSTYGPPDLITTLTYVLIFNENLKLFIFKRNNQKGHNCIIFKQG